MVCITCVSTQGKYTGLNTDQHHHDNHCDFHHDNDHHHMCQLKAAHSQQVSGQTSSTSRTKTRTGGHHDGNQNTGFTTWTLSRVLLLDLRLTASLPLRHSFKDQRIPTLSSRICLSSNLQASRQLTAGCVLIQLVRHFNQSRQYHYTKTPLLSQMSYIVISKIIIS